MRCPEFASFISIVPSPLEKGWDEAEIKYLPVKKFQTIFAIRK